MGYDPIEVSQAASKAVRAIRKSGGSGHVEKKSLTYNGNSEGKETFKFNSLDFARIGDCIDPTAISKIDMLFNGSPLAISKNEIVVTNYTEHDTALSFNGAVGVWILGDENETGVSAGTYVLSAKTYGSYVTRIITETIHPIDPKYLLKVVDLTKYAMEPAEELPATDFNMAVLGLFNNGGGSHAVTDNSNFWSDVNTDSPLRFVIDAEALIPGIKIEAIANSVTMHNGVPNAVEFSFLVKVQDWYRATLMFGNNSNGTTQITVVVAPVFPGA